jgi:serine/threonine protein phosphatase 1
MSKWRPVSTDCLYVIPDIHGQYQQLRLICNRVLPLRKTDGVKDKLVLLGDYIDRRPGGPEVVDFLIAEKKKHKDQLVLLAGNHELMLLDAIEPGLHSRRYDLWMNNGGEQTLSRYLERAGEPMDNPRKFPRFRIKDIIPKEHLEFYRSLEAYHETENYVFVHGGYDPTLPVSNFSKNELSWDRTLFDYVRRSINSPPWTDAYPMDWKKTIVTGHNGVTGEPFITEKFMMLDISIASRLLIVELNSMQAFMAQKNKKRLVEKKITDVSRQSTV